VIGREKTSHLLPVPLTPMRDAWTLEDNNLLHRVLTMMGSKIHDLVFHCVTLKELRCFLRELCGKGNNINKAYGIIHELFQKK